MIQKHTHLVISTATDLLRVDARQILYIQSDGNYCNLVQPGGNIRMISYQLGHVATMIDAQFPDVMNTFMRVGRTLIINLNYVYYINLAKQQLILADNQGNHYTLSPSRDALVALKDFMEKKI